jgi:hypothetical protein
MSHTLEYYKQLAADEEEQGAWRMLMTAPNLACLIASQRSSASASRRSHEVNPMRHELRVQLVRTRRSIYGCRRHPNPNASYAQLRLKNLRKHERSLSRQLRHELPFLRDGVSYAVKGSFHGFRHGIRSRRWLRIATLQGTRWVRVSDSGAHK